MMKSPNEIVAGMMQNDAFSQWLGVEVLTVEKGYCMLKALVKNEMTNGFGIAHGGITYSLADSCLAFASNSHGHQCVSIETTISHLKKVNVGDTLTASSEEISRTRKIGLYAVKITNQNHELVAHFRGTVHISERVW